MSVGIRFIPKEIVYFISDGTAIKVGKTQGDPTNRLKALQTGNSRPLVLEFVAWSCNASAHDLEQALHRKLRHLHIRGEWFDRRGVMDALINEACEIDNNYVWEDKLLVPKSEPLWVTYMANEDLSTVKIGQYRKERT